MVDQEGKRCGHQVGIGHDRIGGVDDIQPGGNPGRVHPLDGIHVRDASDEFAIGIVDRDEERVRMFVRDVAMVRADTDFPAGLFDDGAENPAPEDGQKFHFVAQQHQVMGNVPAHASPGNVHFAGIRIPYPKSLGRRGRNVHIRPADDTHFHTQPKVTAFLPPLQTFVPEGLELGGQI